MNARIAAVAMVVNVALNLALMGPLSYMGMALSTALAAWVNVALLVWRLRRRGYFAPDARLGGRLWRTLAATLAMVAVLFVAERALATALAEPLWRFLALALLVAIGAIAYAAAAVALGAVRRGELAGMLRRS